MVNNNDVKQPAKLYKVFIGNKWFGIWVCLINFKYIVNLSRILFRALIKTNPFASRLATLSIEDDALHVVVFRGTEVDRWGSCPLTPEIIKDGSIVNPLELGKIIYNFLKQYGVKNIKVNCSISGFHSLSRIITLPKLSSSVIYEAIGREVAREMPNAADASHIFWHILNQTRSYQRFYILTTPKDNLEGVAKALKRGKVVSSKVELKPLALSRLVKKPLAIIADVQSRGVDVVIVVQGVPAFFRILNRDEQTPLLNISAEITRVVEYFNRNNTQQRINDDTPLVLTGSLSMDEDEKKQFAAMLKYPLEQLDVFIKYPPGFPLEKYAANIGLALETLTNKKLVPFQWININMLSAVYKPNQAIKKLSMAGAAAVLGFVSIVPLYSISTQLVVATDKAQVRLYEINQEIVAKRLAMKEGVRLESKIKEIQTKVEKLEKAQQTIMPQNTRFALPLATIYQSVNSGITLDSATKSNNQIELQGKADSNKTMVKFIASLEEKGIFPGVRIINLVRRGPSLPEISFSLELKEK